MAGIFNHNSTLKDFPGTAPIFPLPDVVLFPHAVLPLHIFEARYRSMIGDSLKSNRLIVLARLKDDYEELYYTKQAPIYEKACLGRINADHKLPDGRYHLYLEGVVRVTIQQELETDLAYRVGRVKLHRDRHQFSELFDPQVQADRLLQLFRHQIEDVAGQEPLLKILESNLKLGTLCDFLAYASPLEIDQKQLLLEETNIEKRSRLLVQLLAELIETFPPPFSLN